METILTLEKYIYIGMALAPWKVVGGGKIRTDEEEEKRRETGEKGRTMGTGGSDWERNEEEKKVCKALEKVAAQVGAKHITSGIQKVLFLEKKKNSLMLRFKSCHCICHAEDTLRFPGYWRSKGRAPDGQFRGIGNILE